MAEDTADSLCVELNTDIHRYALILTFQNYRIVKQYHLLKKLLFRLLNEEQPLTRNVVVITNMLHVSLYVKLFCQISAYKAL